VTSILIVDDHPSFRGTARALLESEGFEVVGEAADGASAIEAAARMFERADLLADVVQERHVLCVDDDPEFLKSVEDLGRAPKHGHAAVEVEGQDVDGGEALPPPIECARSRGKRRSLRRHDTRGAGVG